VHYRPNSIILQRVNKLCAYLMPVKVNSGTGTCIIHCETQKRGSLLLVTTRQIIRLTDLSYFVQF